MVNHRAREYWIGVLRQLLLKTSVDGVCEWDIRSDDKSIVALLEDLQQSLLLFLPMSPEGILEHQVIDAHRCSIERAIVFLKAGCEFPPKPWISKWWFSLTLVVGVAAMFVGERWGFSFFSLLSVGLLGGLVLVLWLGSLLGLSLIHI